MILKYLKKGIPNPIKHFIIIDFGISDVSTKIIDIKHIRIFGNSEEYYVIHPVLKHIALLTLNEKRQLSFR